MTAERVRCSALLGGTIEALQAVRYELRDMQRALIKQAYGLNWKGAHESARVNCKQADTLDAAIQVVVNMESRIMREHEARQSPNDPKLSDGGGLAQPVRAKAARVG